LFVSILELHAQSNLAGTVSSVLCCLWGAEDACRQGLSDQADAILETASALVALDRRDLDAAWHRAQTALETLPR